MRLTVKDVSDFLNVSTKTIYRWVTAKGLPSYRFNNQYFFSRAEIIEWATENRIPLHRDVLLEIDKDVKEFPPFLTAMEDGGIYYRIQGSNKNEVLRNIVNNLKLPAEVDRDFIFEMLRAREMLGTTAIGQGIAIPHPRSPIIQYIETPSVNLCFLEKPIDFGAQDGEKVFALFTIFSTSVRVHLYLLSRLSYLLHNQDFMLTLRTQSPRDEILKAAKSAELTLKPVTMFDPASE